MKSGIKHDLRRPDYDDWSLDGDLIIYFKALNKCVEVSSMGIRVGEKSFFRKKHIVEVQASSWGEKTLKGIKEWQVL